MGKNITDLLKEIEIGLVKFHKNFTSPFLKQTFTGGCRFQPTCSDYAILAIKKYGPIKGLYLSIVRFLRCNPLSKHPQEYPLT